MVGSDLPRLLTYESQVPIDSQDIPVAYFLECITRLKL